MSLESVLQQLRHNLGKDYLASGLIGLDGIHLAFDSLEPDFDEARMAAELADVLSNMMDLARQIAAGNINYIILATERCKILLYPVTTGGDSNYFSCLNIKAEGNMGKAILEMEKARKILENELI